MYFKFSYFIFLDPLVGTSLQVCKLPTSSRGRSSAMSSDVDFGKFVKVNTHLKQKSQQIESLLEFLKIRNYLFEIYFEAVNYEKKDMKILEQNN